eukprot:533651_1
MLIHFFNITVGTIGIISTILILIALIIKFILNNKRRKSSLQRMTSNPHDLPIYYWRFALDILTNICIISFLIHAASVSLIRFNLYPATFCPWVTRCTISVYHITRCTLYAILVIRIHIGFSNSMYSYSQKHIIYPLFILIILWFITALSFDIISNVVNGKYNIKYQTCSPIFKSYAVIVSGTFDVLFCTILLILFIRPLIKLNRNMKRDQHLERLSTRQFTMDIYKLNAKTKLDVKQSKTTESEHITRNNDIDLCVSSDINTININVTPIHLHSHTSVSSNISNTCTPISITSNISSELEIGTIKLQMSEEITEINENKEMDIYTEDIPQWNINNPSFTNSTNSVNYDIKRKNKILKSLSSQTEHQRNLHTIELHFENIIIF